MVSRINKQNSISCCQEPQLQNIPYTCIVNWIKFLHDRLFYLLYTKGINCLSANYETLLILILFSVNLIDVRLDRRNKTFRRI